MIHEGTETVQKLSESSIALQNSTSKVIYLDLVTSENGFMIAAVQEDGTVTSTSSDLKHVSLSKIEAKSDSARAVLLTAYPLSLQEALKSVLKNRGDIAKDLPEDSLIIPAFGIEEIDRGCRPFYAVWSLRPGSSQSIGSPNVAPAQLLFEHDLSNPDLTGLKNIQPSNVHFGPRASTLDIKTSRSLVRYKLGGTVPSRLSRSQTDAAGASDMLQLSSIYTLIATPTSLQILDAKYGVTQATLDLKSSKKRKQPGSNVPTGVIELLTHFSQAHRVLARIGTTLVAIDVRLGEQSGQTRTSRLANNVGLGRLAATNSDLNPLSLSFAETPNALNEEWSEQKEKLDRMVAKKDATGFENTIFSQLPTKANKRSRRALGVFDTIVDYAIIKMFSISSQTENDRSAPGRVLRLDFVAPRLIEWLSSAGLLCFWRLKKAFGSQYDQHGVGALESGAISRALCDADKSLSLLLTHIKHNSSPDVQEQIDTLKLLMSLAQATSESKIEETSQPQNQSTALVPTADQTGGLDEVPMDSESLPPALIEAIVLLMNRLGALDQTVLSTRFRRSLSPEEITTSIQLLRQQLFQGGHASWVANSVAVARGGPPDANEGETTQENTTSMVSFESIVKMLSACLDTIGPLELLDSGGQGPMVEGIIPDLLSEVELSAQYIEDSAELQGILRETLRFSYSQDLQLRQKTAATKEPRKAGRSIGEIVTVYSEHPDDEATDNTIGMLPLSLRDDGVVDPVRVRKGGGQVSERSKREMLMLEGRQKGSYSFERLIL